MNGEALFFALSAADEKYVSASAPDAGKISGAKGAIIAKIAAAAACLVLLAAAALWLFVPGVGNPFVTQADVLRAWGFMLDGKYPVQYNDNKSGMSNMEMMTAKLRAGERLADKGDTEFFRDKSCPDLGRIVVRYGDAWTYAVFEGFVDPNSVLFYDTQIPEEPPFEGMTAAQMLGLIYDTAGIGSVSPVNGKGDRYGSALTGTDAERFWGLLDRLPASPGELAGMDRNGRSDIFLVSTVNGTPIRLRFDDKNRLLWQDTLTVIRLSGDEAEWLVSASGVGTLPPETLRPADEYTGAGDEATEVPPEAPAP